MLHTIKKISIAFCASLLVVMGAWFSINAFAQDAPRPTADLLTVKGAIGPAVADYLVRGIEHAEKNKTDLVVIKMDTPGGLSTSMREIIQVIINSNVPVATFVAPKGARAASAGTYILYASHVAAMAPGTNLGAATPVSIGMPGSGDKQDGNKPTTDKKGNPIPKTAMERKMRNDAVAYIQGLAEIHGRNAKWAEEAVRKASSLSSTEAVKNNVVDFIAKDVPDLMSKINGEVVNLDGKKVTLNTDNIVVRNKAPDWRSRFLAVITNPSFAYILMLLGVYGLILEFTNPGLFLPGVIGTISLLLAMYAFALLPINYVGLALMFVGLGFMISEAFIPSFGVLGIGGVIAFIIGSVMLIDHQLPSFQIALWLIVSVAMTTGLTMFLLLSMAIRSRNRPVVSGSEALIGSVGKVISIEDNIINVRVSGELWQAKCDQSVIIGQIVTVVALDGLILQVLPKS